MTKDDNRPDRKVEQLAEDARGRVEQVAEQAREELAEVQARVRELRRELVNRAMAVKDRAAEEMLSAAQRIRREARQTDDAETVAKAEEIAAGLEWTARYLDRQSIEQVGQEVAAAIQQNVWLALALAFVTGLVMGLLMGIIGRRR